MTHPNLHGFHNFYIDCYIVLTNVCYSVCVCERDRHLHLCWLYTGLSLSHSVSSLWSVYQCVVFEVVRSPMSLSVSPVEVHYGITFEKHTTVLLLLFNVSYRAPYLDYDLLNGTRVVVCVCWLRQCGTDLSAQNQCVCYLKYNAVDEYLWSVCRWAHLPQVTFVLL